MLATSIAPQQRCFIIVTGTFRDAVLAVSQYTTKALEEAHATPTSIHAFAWLTEDDLHDWWARSVEASWPRPPGMLTFYGVDE